MKLTAEIEKLSAWREKLLHIGMQVLGGNGSSISVLDFIAIGAIKRSVSLSSGLAAMVESKNMVCSRALLRMQLDTASRFLAYSYVDNPEAVAREVFGGKQLNTFKCRDGKKLRDAYLIDRMTQKHEWVRRVYESTSSYIHFSERQFFDSISALGSDQDRTFTLEIGVTDVKFPESSWVEVVECFNELHEILAEALQGYRLR